ncbi:hypothetical protein ACCS93_29660 [Rhizobium ruizarguesonis]
MTLAKAYEFDLPFSETGKCPIPPAGERLDPNLHQANGSRSAQSEAPDFACNVRELLSRIGTLSQDQKWQILKQMALIRNQTIKAGLLLTASRRIQRFSWTQVVFIQSVVNEAFFANDDDAIRQLLCDALATIRRSMGSIEIGIHNYHPALLHGLAPADTRFYSGARSTLTGEESKRR